MKPLLKKTCLSVICLLAATNTMAYDFEYDGCYFDIISETNKTCKITYKNLLVETPTYCGDFAIPELVKDDDGTIYKCVAIGHSAFGYCKSLTSVTIPMSVTTIGDYAFVNCKSLTSVDIPESVTTIGDYAFFSCESLTSVDIPESVTTIGKYTFSFCKSLTSLVIPESVTTIGNGAFSSCESLAIVTIPESVATIGEFTFANCKSLTSVNIPKSVTKIGMGAFSNCQNLKEIIVDENNNYFVTSNRLLYSKDISTLYWCPTDETSVTIPKSVTTIEGAAFRNCKNLMSINIPTSVTSIKTGAFSGCYKLKEIIIPSSVITIENGAFSGCNSLTELTIPFSVKSIHPKLGSISNEIRFNIEDGFTSLEISEEYLSGPVYYNSNIIPKELYIGRGIIVNHNNDYKLIETNTGLEKVTFSQYVTSVDDIGMYNAKDLKTVVVCGLTPPTIADDFFSTDQYNNATLYVPEGAAGTYTKAQGWRYFYNIVEGLPTDISQTESQAKMTVTAEDGGIMVRNAKGAIQVYTSAGSLIENATANGDVKITVPSHGVYIVKAGGKTVKIAL